MIYCLIGIYVFFSLRKNRDSTQVQRSCFFVLCLVMLMAVSCKLLFMKQISQILMLIPIGLLVFYGKELKISKSDLQKEKEAWNLLFGFVLISTSLCIGVCQMGMSRFFLRNWVRIPFLEELDSFLWSLLLYIPFAAIQEYILLPFVMKGIQQRFNNQWLIAVASGALFSLAHLPMLYLLLPCFVAGTIWSYFYLRCGRFWVVVLAHAILATAFFQFFIGMAPIKILYRMLGSIG